MKNPMAIQTANLIHVMTGAGEGAFEEIARGAEISNLGGNLLVAHAAEQRGAWTHPKG